MKNALFLLALCVACSLTACQRNKYPEGRVEAPANAPAYTTQADKEPAIKVP